MKYATPVFMSAQQEQELSAKLIQIARILGGRIYAGDTIDINREIDGSVGDAAKYRFTLSFSAVAELKKRNA